MSVELIRRPDGLGEPLGRYSHVALGTGTLVAVAGQVGMNPDGSLAGPDLAAQVRHAYRNLGIALGAAGCSYDDILKMTTYLVGHHLIAEFMEARTEIFAELFPSAQYPPNTLAIVSRLVEEPLLFEVEALALRQ